MLSSMAAALLLLERRAAALAMRACSLSSLRRALSVVPLRQCIPHAEHPIPNSQPYRTNRARADVPLPTSAPGGAIPPLWRIGALQGIVLGGLGRAGPEGSLVQRRGVSLVGGARSVSRRAAAKARQLAASPKPPAVQSALPSPPNVKPKPVSVKDKPLAVYDTTFVFTSRKAWQVRGIVMLSVTCCAFVVGFSTFLYTNLIFFDAGPRLVFIVFMGVFAGAMLTAASKFQKRYVLSIARDQFTPGKIRVSCPFFLGSKSISVSPSSINAANITLSEVFFGASATDTDLPLPEPQILLARRVYAISVDGFKMIVDAEGLSASDREKVLRLLGLIR